MKFCLTMLRPKPTNLCEIMPGILKSNVFNFLHPTKFGLKIICVCLYKTRLCSLCGSFLIFYHFVAMGLLNHCWPVDLQACSITWKSAGPLLEFSLFIFKDLMCKILCVCIGNEYGQYLGKPIYSWLLLHEFNDQIGRLSNSSLTPILRQPHPGLLLTYLLKSHSLTTTTTTMMTSTVFKRDRGKFAKASNVCFINCLSSGTNPVTSFDGVIFRFMLFDKCFSLRPTSERPSNYFLLWYKMDYYRYLCTFQQKHFVALDSKFQLKWPNG